MLQDEAESNGIDGESVFFDPNDTWTKEEDDPLPHVPNPPTQISTNQQATMYKTTATMETSTGTGMTHKPGMVNVTAAPKPIKPDKPSGGGLLKLGQAKPAWVSDTSLIDDKPIVNM